MRSLKFVVPALVALVLAVPAEAAALRVSIGCQAVDSCSDWQWASAFKAKLKERGLDSEIVVGGALGNDQSVADQLSQGLLEVGVTNFAVIRQAEPLILGFLAPYMFDSLQHMFRVIDGTDISARIDKGIGSQHLKLGAILGVGGAIGIFNNRRPVEKPADLAGLRLRAIDKTQLALFQIWGAQGVVVDIAEVATSLQTGVVDGYANPAAVAIAYQHTDLLKFYTDAGAGQGIRTALMSRDWYSGLDAKTRAAVDEAVAFATAANRDWTLRVAAEELKTLSAKGVKVGKLSPEGRQQFVDLSKKAWALLMPPEAVAAFTAAADKARE
ncbi:MAG: TRAP transporter substrate-binding protein [Bauldia sp.]